MAITAQYRLAASVQLGRVGFVDLPTAWNPPAGSDYRGPGLEVPVDIGNFRLRQSTVVPAQERTQANAIVWTQPRTVKDSEVAMTVEDGGRVAVIAWLGTGALTGSCES